MTNKVALVTGASTGLGISISIKLARSGYKVYASMRNLDKKGTLLKACEESGVIVELLQLDVQDTLSVNNAVSKIINESSQIDLLVNNAGAGLVKTTEHVSDEEVEWMLDVNLKGVIRCTRAVLSHMREKKNGHIINISSVGGLVGQPFNEIYCAAKFGLEGYTEGLACYIGPAFNIKFTCVEPGGIQSEFANNVLNHLQKSGGMPTDEYGPILQNYIGKAGEQRADGIYQTADEVADVVIKCVENENPPLRLRTSEWAEKFSSLKTKADPTGNLLVAEVREQML